MRNRKRKAAAFEKPKYKMWEYDFEQILPKYGTDPTQLNTEKRVQYAEIFSEEFKFDFRRNHLIRHLRELDLYESN